MIYIYIYDIMIYIYVYILFIFFGICIDYPFDGSIPRMAKFQGSASWLAGTEAWHDTTILYGNMWKN